MQPDCKKDLDAPLFVIAVVGSVSNDDVVLERNAHGVTCCSQTVSQIVVHLAGAQTA